MADSSRYRIQPIKCPRQRWVTGTVWKLVFETINNKFLKAQILLTIWEHIFLVNISGVMTTQLKEIHKRMLQYIIFTCEQPNQMSLNKDKSWWLKILLWACIFKLLVCRKASVSTGTWRGATSYWPARQRSSWLIMASRVRWEVKLVDYGI